MTITLSRNHYRLVNPVSKWQVIAGVIGVGIASLAYGLLG